MTCGISEIFCFCIQVLDIIAIHKRMCSIFKIRVHCHTSKWARDKMSGTFKSTVDAWRVIYLFFTRKRNKNVRKASIIQLMNLLIKRKKWGRPNKTRGMKGNVGLIRRWNEGDYRRQKWSLIFVGFIGETKPLPIRVHVFLKQIPPPKKKN